MVYVNSAIEEIVVTYIGKFEKLTLSTNKHL